jgi:transposase InsO family protein
VTRYVEERREAFGVEPVCRALGVPVSTFYARRSRKPSRRVLEDRKLLVEIYAARAGYRQVYGVRKTWKELRRRGVEVGRDRVARLMRAEGLVGVRRGTKRRTTIPEEAALERARDLLQRDFSASSPNEKWVADITYLRTWSGFCYLAFILDCYSRLLVGWQLATHLRTELVLDALEMANGLRRPAAGADRALGSRLPVHEHRLHRPPRRARARTLRRLAGRRLRQRAGGSLGRDLQVRTRRRLPLPKLRACRTRGPALDRLLQRGETARRAR